MTYACDKCHFLFSRISVPDQCPDCGKEAICPATEGECEEFEARKRENLWKDSEGRQRL